MTRIGEILFRQEILEKSPEERLFVPLAATSDVRKRLTTILIALGQTIPVNQEALTQQVPIGSELQGKSSD